MTKKELENIVDILDTSTAHHIDVTIYARKPGSADYNTVKYSINQHTPKHQYTLEAVKSLVGRAVRRELKEAKE